MFAEAMYRDLTHRKPSLKLTRDRAGRRGSDDRHALVRLIRICMWGRWWFKVGADHAVRGLLITIAAIGLAAFHDNGIVSGVG
jgi:hypothetical protein